MPTKFIGVMSRTKLELELELGRFCLAAQCLKRPSSSSSSIIFEGATN